MNELHLDELRVVPTGQAWHKARALSSSHHRLAMARLAFSGLERVVIDARETQRAGPSYTVQTLHELTALWPGADLYLIVGEDQARALSSWMSWQEVLQLAIICVAERDVGTGARPVFDPPKLYESRFRSLPMPAMRVSATELRARIAEHRSLSPLVFDAVARYIDDHHLYQTA